MYILTEQFFNKYKKTEDKDNVLLMYLILNDYDLEQVETISRTEEKRKFGLTIRKVYGKTKEFVDIKKIEKEVENTVYPTVCSVSSYEFYSRSPMIYVHQPMIEEKPLLINDLGVISPFMVIDNEFVISANEAKPLAETEDCGFTYFMQYVLQEDVIIGKWHLSYKDKVFNIGYLSGEDVITEQSLYTAIEIDKTSTYKMVIYIIRKVAHTLEEWVGDNFDAQSYEMVRNENG